MKSWSSFLSRPVHLCSKIVTFNVFILNTQRVSSGGLINMPSLNGSVDWHMAL